MEEVVIRVTGRLDSSWQNWIGGLDIAYLEGDTIFSGTLRDQSALYGTLSQLSRLGLRLVSVNLKPTDNHQSGK